MHRRVPPRAGAADGPLTLVRHHVQAHAVAYLWRARRTGAASARADVAQPCLTPLPSRPSRRPARSRLRGSRHDGITRARDVAAAEEPLDVRLHGRSFAVIMRTPGEDRALAAGFLLSERIIRSAADIGAIEHCRHPDQSKRITWWTCSSWVTPRPRSALLEQRRQVIANSSCGSAAAPPSTSSRPTVAPCRLDRDDAAERDERSRPPARATVPVRRNRRPPRRGAFHIRGTLLGSAEDVGRHNAVDKVIGSFSLRPAPAVLRLPAPDGQRTRVVRDRPEGLARRLRIVAAPRRRPARLLRWLSRPALRCSGSHTKPARTFTRMPPESMVCSQILTCSPAPSSSLLTMSGRSPSI